MPSGVAGPAVGCGGWWGWRWSGRVARQSRKAGKAGMVARGSASRSVRHSASFRHHPHPSAASRLVARLALVLGSVHFARGGSHGQGFCFSLGGLGARAAPRTPGIVYVGRACAGWPASPLGNPFKRAVVGSKEEAISRYRAWLRSVVRRALAGEALPPAEAAAWAELARLARLAAAGEALTLGCWCAPLACHAEVIRDAVQWLASSSRV